MKPDAQDHVVQLAQAAVKFCRNYAIGNCKFGSKCSLDHPEKLRPDLEPESDYQVSDEKAAACQRCIDKHLPCDKSQRDANDKDPCPECRYFGGENAKCIIAANISRNDQMWKQMENSPTYSLPKFTPRNTPLKDHKSTPKDKDGNKVQRFAQPMRDDRVKADWNGPTRDEVLNQPDMLPAHVRECPRAYIYAPGPAHQQTRAKERRALFGKGEEPKAPEKRKRQSVPDDAQSGAQRYGVPSYSLSPIQRPPPIYGRGHPESMELKWASDGSIVSGAAKYPSLDGDGGITVVYSPAPTEMAIRPATGSSGSHGPALDQQALKRRRFHLDTAQQPAVQPRSRQLTAMDLDVPSTTTVSGDAFLDAHAVALPTSDRDTVDSERDEDREEDVAADDDMDADIGYESS